jgi:hypothetical protein
MEEHGQAGGRRRQTATVTVPVSLGEVNELNEIWPYMCLALFQHVTLLNMTANESVSRRVVQFVAPVFETLEAQVVYIKSPTNC